MSNQIELNRIKKLGIIGAGGAGFPAHVKLNSNPDTLIMNAAECEPLLHKDIEIILNYTDQVLKGFDIAMNITGAKNGIIGIKEKHTKEIELLNSKVGNNVKVIPVEDVYPAGDEVTLIYMTTKRIVPPGALPISVGCIVQNVETLYNIGNNIPVVEKFITVAGAVDRPATIKVPVGISFAEVLSKFNINVPNYAVISNGLMMGKLEMNLNKVISKRTGALIVLPEDHYCVNLYKRYSSEKNVDKIAKAGCDQCSFCTELCPRYLIGYPVRPEIAMRNRIFSEIKEERVFTGNMFCCECNLCTVYACPEGLDPRGATIIEKRIVRRENYKWNYGNITLHPMYDYRKVPSRKLKQRLDITMFKDEGQLLNLNFNPSKVKIPLNQHVGTPAVPIVAEGQHVKKYDLIAESQGDISCDIHASINGIVRKISEEEIVLERD